MAATRRKAAIEEVPPVEPQVDDVVQYDLEPLTEEIASNLNIWGNSCVLTIGKLKEAHAPEWARVIQDIFGTVGLAISSMKEE